MNKLNYVNIYYYGRLEKKKLEIGLNWYCILYVNVEWPRR